MHAPTQNVSVLGTSFLEPEIAKVATIGVRIEEIGGRIADEHASRASTKKYIMQNVLFIVSLPMKSRTNSNV